MTVEDLMTRNVETCTPTDTLSAAAQLMWDHDFGCIPVVSEDGSKCVVGMLTDRDICMATHCEGASPGAVRVGDVMSTGLRACRSPSSTGVAAAVSRMRLRTSRGRRSASRSAIWSMRSPL